MLSTGVAVSRDTAGGQAATTTAKQPPSLADALQKGRRSRRHFHVLLAAVTTILIASAYTVHQRNAMAPNALDVPLESAVAGESNADAAPAVPPIAQAHQVEPGTAAALAVPNTTDAQVVADHSASAALREPASPEDPAAVANSISVPRDVTPSTTQQANAQQRPVPQRETSTVSRTTRARASTPVGVPVSKTRKSLTHLR